MNNNGGRGGEDVDGKPSMVEEEGDRDELSEKYCRGRKENRASELTKDKGAEGERDGKEKTGRRMEKSITSSPGVVTLKKSQWPRTKLSTHALFLSSSPSPRLFIPSKASASQFIAPFLPSL